MLFFSLPLKEATGDEAQKSSFPECVVLESWSLGTLAPQPYPGGHLFLFCMWHAVSTFLPTLDPILSVA